MSLQHKIRVVQLTDVGRVREHNEDAIGGNPDIGLLVLADGMGGYSAGEVASGIAVRTTLEMVAAACEHEERAALDAETRLMRQSIILRDAIARANKVIYHTAHRQQRCEGMGTTIVALLFYDNRVSIAHVGDSRIYRYRRGRFEQVTMDHSLLQELVDRGYYSPSEAARSTNRNYVTRALGVEPMVDVEIHEDSVLPGDVYLMCSDGLSDMVDDEDIQLTISTFNANLDVAGQQLIRLSNDHGGKDNISVILAQVLEPFPARAGLLSRVKGIFR